jgi:hypothetical protein
MDGILFEIFFDSGAQLREQPKNLCLDKMFELQKYEELSASFAFISECLLTHADRFHTLPGKNLLITVGVVTKKKAGNKRVVKKCGSTGRTSCGLTTIASPVHLRMIPGLERFRRRILRSVSPMKLDR